MIVCRLVGNNGSLIISRIDEWWCKASGSKRASSASPAIHAHVLPLYAFFMTLCASLLLHFTPAHFFLLCMHRPPTNATRSLARLKNWLKYFFKYLIYLCLYTWWVRQRIGMDHDKRRVCLFVRSGRFYDGLDRAGKVSWIHTKAIKMPFTHSLHLTHPFRSLTSQ